MKLKPFQLEFERAVENPAYDTIAISGPRSLGKTFLAARILTRCLTPGDVLHQPGKEYILAAASLEQARLTYQFIREALEYSDDYRWLDSTTRLGATHKPTNTKLRAISSNAKTSFGLVNVPVVVLDEPGALDIVGGQMLADSLFTAQGKTGSRLKLILCGTLAPLATSAGHWWFDLVRTGSTRSTYVAHYHGNLETWDKWSTIRKANPLIDVDAFTRRKVLEERDAARRDTRLKARFLSYRLNLPTRDEAQMLLTTDDWKRVTSRAVPEREGRPAVGIDLGGGRAWSAATALYPNGRVEATAVMPGIPDVAAQEARDTVPAGTYQRLVDSGILAVADGLRVPTVRHLWERVLEAWGKPSYVVLDRFRLSEFRDAVKGGVKVEPRVTRWSEASFDIRALRKMARDGPLSCEVESRNLLTASLSVAGVVSDDAGNTRQVKRGSKNQSRDDVAAALTLAAGGVARHPKRDGGFYLGLSE